MRKFFSAACLAIMVMFSAAAFAGENHQKGDKQYAARNAEKMKYKQQKQKAEAQRKLAKQKNEAQRKLKKQKHEAARHQLKQRHAEVQQQKEALQNHPQSGDQP